MKSIFKSALLALVFSVVCSSCSMLGFDRIQYTSYIANQTDKDVTITYNMMGRNVSIFIPSGSEKEIDDKDRVNLFEYPITIGKVLFSFSDGSSYIHSCESTLVSDDEEIVEFTPKINNILSANYAASWIMSSDGGKKVKYLYLIKY